MELLEKLPFIANGHDLEVWIFRNALAGEFAVHVRQDGARVMFLWPDGNKAAASYTASFEIELDTRLTTNTSAVARIVEAAKADAHMMSFEKARSDG